MKDMKGSFQSPLLQGNVQSLKPWANKKTRSLIRENKLRPTRLNHELFFFLHALHVLHGELLLKRFTI